MESKYYSEMTNNINDLIKKGFLKDRRIYLFGHCNATEEMLQYLLSNEIIVQSILDNNQSKQNMLCYGIRIEAPEKIKKQPNSSEELSLVLIASRAYEAMAKQLMGLNYKGHIIKVVDYDTFSFYSLEQPIFWEKLERMERGNRILDQIQNERGEKFLLICPYNALGDVYYAMAFLSEYLRKVQHNEYIVCVTGKACGQIAELFDADQIEILEQKDMDELVQAMLFVQPDNCLIAHHDRPYTNDMIRCLDSHFVSFIDFYRCGVYGLGTSSEPQLPCGGKKYRNCDQLQQGKTVIVAPYAKSVVEIPKEFWRKLILDYQEQGYLVCTNVTGEETEIEGTIPIRIPINEMISAVEYGGCFVGLRSGMCDVISAARCRKIVIFPDCTYSTTNIKVEHFFDLLGWEKVIYKSER